MENIEKRQEQVLDEREAALMKLPATRKLAPGFTGWAFSRTVGVKYWCCPACNFLNSHQVRPQNWKVRCGNSDCRKVYAIGEVFYEVPSGFKAPPPDTLMPRALSAGLSVPVNRVYCDGCAKLMYTEGFKREIEGALNASEERWGDAEEKRMDRLEHWHKTTKGIGTRRNQFVREEYNEEIGC